MKRKVFAALITAGMLASSLTVVHGLDTEVTVSK